MSDDDPFRLPYLPNMPLGATKLREPEPLFEFQRHGRILSCELRYHGEYGVEAVFYDDGSDFYSRRFDSVAVRDPIHEAIATRTHELFMARGGAHGHDIDDGVRAEQELTARQAALRLR